jgi:hypothetical protein
MAARDRFTIDLTCPQCGRAGSAHVSEDDYPFMASPRFSVDHLPPGFQVARRAPTMQGTVIVCEDCGIPVK